MAERGPRRGRAAGAAGVGGGGARAGRPVAAPGSPPVTCLQEEVQLPLTGSSAPVLGPAANRCNHTPSLHRTQQRGFRSPPRRARPAASPALFSFFPPRALFSFPLSFFSLFLSKEEGGERDSGTALSQNRRSDGLGAPVQTPGQTPADIPIDFFAHRPKKKAHTHTHTPR